MKNKLTKKYLLVSSISAIIIVAVWLLLTIVFVLSDKNVDESQPQYLVNSFEQYIDPNNGFKIKEEGKQILNKNHIWAQVIDKKGRVIESYNTPQYAPSEYNMFEICDYTLNSKKLGDQTIFVSQFQDAGDYGVIVGCNAAKVTKVNLKLTGGVRKSIVESVIIFLIVFSITGICAGVIYSKNISSPVNDIIEEINCLEADAEYNKKKCKNTIFQSVFDSLEKLKLRLISADKERKDAEKQRQEWITNISHDMKTPLSAIRGYAELMEDEEYEISDAERRKYSKKIIHQSDTIKSLIDELKFGRLLENGDIQLHREEVNLYQLLKECCDDIPVTVAQNCFSFSFADTPVYANVDRHLMKRCLQNIICNALIHNNKQVDVLIKCYWKNKAVIEIHDNGKGMSEEELKKIFERYYRGKSSKEISGSGLGLAIAKQIVESHGGEISVKSIVDKGTTFFIQI